MPVVKICGITNIEDALSSYEFGADLLGFVFIGKSQRYVTKEEAGVIISGFREKVTGFNGMTGLFLNESPDSVVETILFCGLDAVQLHGDENPEFCALLKKRLSTEYERDIKIIKTFKVAGSILPAGGYFTGDYPDADFLLFDTFRDGSSGGTGKTFNWDVLAKNRDTVRKPFFLAGGLNPGNVISAIETVDPFGVDISTGVERSPGVKDTELLKEFIQNAKKK